MKLFAFWRYDLFPYVLGAPFEKMDDKGRVFAEGYNGCFIPLKILPLEPGKALKNKLNGLRDLEKAAHKKVDKDFKEKLKELMPEAIRK
jgi:hypothetical protein